MKEKFKKILEENGIYGEEPEDVLYAVHDMILFIADKIKEEEPYATNSIERMENTAYEVYSLIGYCVNE